MGVILARGDSKKQRLLGRKSCDEGAQWSTCVALIMIIFIVVMTHLDRDSDPDVDVKAIQIHRIASFPYILHIVEECGLIPAPPHTHMPTCKHTYKVHCQRFCEYKSARMPLDGHTHTHTHTHRRVAACSLSLSLSCHSHLSL